MNKRILSKERGQALILILLATVGLIGLTALAVDGGHVFATQRQARNAADTAAFAAAIANVEVAGARDDTCDPFFPEGNEAAIRTALKSAGLARAASNNFADDTIDPGVNSGQAIDVIVHWPPKQDPSVTPQFYVDNCDYVQVIIAAQVPTFFAPVIGVSSLPIRVQAVVKALPISWGKPGGDNGIVALGDVCNGVRTHGNGETHITGGGVFSNSTADGSSGNCWAFNAGGTDGQISTDGATMVGCLDPGDISDGKIVYNAPNTFDPATDCGAVPEDYPPPALALGFKCSDFDPGDTINGGTTARPGRWSQAAGNLGGNEVFPPAGVTTLEAGVYCITGKFNLGSTDSLTSAGGVTFVLDGSLRWNAGATINLTPSDDTPYDGKIANLLIYRPLNDTFTGLCDGGGSPPCQTLQFNGGADATWSGKIFAPDSNCDITGTQDGITLIGQAICYVVDIGGDSTWEITYDGTDDPGLAFSGETELNR